MVSHSLTILTVILTVSLKLIDFIDLFSETRLKPGLTLRIVHPGIPQGRGNNTRVYLREEGITPGYTSGLRRDEAQRGPPTLGLRRDEVQRGSPTLGSPMVGRHNEALSPSVSPWLRR